MVWLELTEPWTSVEIISVSETLDLDIGPTSLVNAASRTGAHLTARGDSWPTGTSATRYWSAANAVRMRPVLVRSEQLGLGCQFGKLDKTWTDPVPPIVRANQCAPLVHLCQ